MKNFIKSILKTITPRFIQEINKNRFKQNQLRKWEENGCPMPPPHIVKQLAIQEYHKTSKYNTLVETGTYLGDMVEAQKKVFEKIYSIELGMELFQKAIHRFRHDKNVTIVQGDSGLMLHEIVQQLNEPAIFWLDGHYSAGITAKGEKDCPIFGEMDAILNNNKFQHIILIDDARYFVGQGDYPTIDQLTEYVTSKNRNYHVDVKNDIIRYTVV